ncbi:MAG: hypothetical protein JJ956_06595 [Pseudomonadales bacterium]|nr:hypothetical protein [Pseudomonadales bacterium]
MSLSRLKANLRVATIGLLIATFFGGIYFTYRDWKSPPRLTEIRGDLGRIECRMGGKYTYLRVTLLPNLETYSLPEVFFMDCGHARRILKVGDSLNLLVDSTGKAWEVRNGSKMIYSEEEYFSWLEDVNHTVLPLLGILVPLFLALFWLVLWERKYDLARDSDRAT